MRAAILTLFILSAAAGCLELDGDLGPVTRLNTPAFCTLHEVRIYEFGEQAIHRDATAAVQQELRAFFPAIQFTFEQAPSANEVSYLAYRDQGNVDAGILAVAYTDVPAPDDYLAAAWGGYITMHPVEWKQWTKIGPLQIGLQPPVEPAGLAAAETQILLHEIGHELGLIDLGLASSANRALEDDPHHSSDPRSVMTPYASSPALVLDGERPLHFTEDDWADLRGAHLPDGACAKWGR